LEASDDVGQPRRLRELQPVSLGEVETGLQCRRTTGNKGGSLAEEHFEPPGLMISIMWAGSGPAFHMA